VQISLLKLRLLQLIMGKESNTLPRNKKKILFITPQPFLADRGSPLRVKSEIDSLLSLGYEIDVLCFPFGNEYKQSGVTIYRSLGVPGISVPVVGPSWQKIALDIPLSIKGIILGLKNSYHVIHGVEEAAYIAAIIGSIKRVPYVVDMHSLLPDQLRYSGFLSNKIFLKMAYASYNMCLKKSSGIIAVCKDIQIYASQIAPRIPCAQLEDLPLDSSWDVDPKHQEKLKDQFALHDKTILTYTGNFSSYQGIPLLIKAFTNALTKLEHAHSARLLMVGETNLELIEEAKKIARDAGIMEHIIFTGELPSSAMGSIMGISDAVISPRTKGSNTPLKVYCYMASGRPIVATSIFSHTQALTNDAAYLASPEPSALGEAIYKALSQSPEAKQEQSLKAKKAKEILALRFNKQLFTESMGWLYERVTNAPLPVCPSQTSEKECKFAI
jgi:glycosyltransferase involved in cell wall biosynthesis